MKQSTFNQLTGIVERADKIRTDALRCMTTDPVVQPPVEPAPMAKVVSSLWADCEHESPEGVEIAYSSSGWAHDSDGKGGINMRDPSNLAAPWDQRMLYTLDKCDVPADSDKVFMYDREGRDFQVLKYGPTHPDYGQAVAAGCTCIAWLRAHRPNMRVGFYAYPNNNDQDQSQAWRDNWMAYPLWDAVDVILVSIYKWYQGQNAAELQKYINAVQLALDIGAEHNKPVVIVSTHRWTGGTQPQGLIPDQEYIDFYRTFIDMGASGQFCWGSDRYSYDQEDEWYFSEIKKEMSASLQPQTSDEYIAGLYGRVETNALAVFS